MPGQPSAKQAARRTVAGAAARAAAAEATTKSAAAAAETPAPLPLVAPAAAALSTRCSLGAWSPTAAAASATAAAAKHHAPSSSSCSREPPPVAGPECKKPVSAFDFLGGGVSLPLRAGPAPARAAPSPPPRKRDCDRCCVGASPAGAEPESLLSQLGWGFPLVAVRRQCTMFPVIAFATPQRAVTASDGAGATSRACGRSSSAAGAAANRGRSVGSCSSGGGKIREASVSQDSSSSSEISDGDDAFRRRAAGMQDLDVLCDWDDEEEGEQSEYEEGEGYQGSCHSSLSTRPDSKYEHAWGPDEAGSPTSMARSGAKCPEACGRGRRMEADGKSPMPRHLESQVDLTLRAGAAEIAPAGDRDRRTEAAANESPHPRPVGPAVSISPQFC
eukprot:TRINITY_DN1322_c0_g2_i1.p1 TRINITY_DN1322_c0_g2~~TRINITY_DN1322_c0_g2_i1.p1  ORF type:complete len:405 (-),score=91.83 TRINITY_DN1322_c0_g2_i1:39-1205(-)